VFQEQSLAQRKQHRHEPTLEKKTEKPHQKTLEEQQNRNRNSLSKTF